MKRLSLLLAIVLALALMAPSVAMATEPIILMPPETGTLHVPANVPLTNFAAWLAIGRGLTMHGAECTQFYVTITNSHDEKVLEVLPADSWRYWHKGVVVADPDIYGDLAAFNTKIRATVFAKEWERLMPDGLPSGSYHVVSGYIQTKPLFDLMAYGQSTPLRLPADDYAFPEWDFIVD